MQFLPYFALAGPPARRCGVARHPGYCSTRLSWRCPCVGFGFPMSWFERDRPVFLQREQRARFALTGPFSCPLFGGQVAVQPANCPLFGGHGDARAGRMERHR